MKKITYSVAFVATLLATSNTFAQQGFGTNTPDKSAAVEIKSTNKGLLIPRVALNSETQQLGLVANANSLLVFNETGTLARGYYYWDADATNGGKWIPFSTVGGSNALGAENALTLNTTTNKVELGGTLNRETQITLSGNKFTIASGDNKFKITGLNEITGVTNTDGYTRPNVQLLVNDSEDKVRVYNPSQLLKDYLIGKNGVTVQNDLGTGDAIVKLGGTIDEPTNFNIVQGGSIAVQGLKRMDGTEVSATLATNDSSVGALGGGHLVPVGTTMNGELKVATAKEIVDAGIVSVSTTLPTQNTTNILTTKINNQTDQTATVDLNTLVLTGDVTGTLNTTTVSKIQGVNVNQTAPQTAASQGEVLGIGTDGNWTRMSAGDIVSTGVNANNGLTKDGNLIQLGGNLIKNTTIGANDNKLVIKNGAIDDTTKTGIRFEGNGLYVDNIQGWHEIETASTPDAQEMVVAVGKMDTKQMAAATPNQLVRAGFEPDSGIEWDTTNSTERKVVLGGTLDKATTLTTSTSNTLAIAGLEDNTNDGAWDFVVLDKDNKMRTLVKHQTLEQTITASTGLTGYNPLAQNVSVLLTLNGTQVSGNYASTDDMTLTLPTVSTTNIGQTLTVRISDSNENRFLVISGANEPIYGSMTNQEWVFQAEGSTWKVISRK